MTVGGQPKNLPNVSAKGVRLLSLYEVLSLIIAVAVLAYMIYMDRKQPPS